MSVEGVLLPNGLETLSFGTEFNQSVEDLVLPDSLQTLAWPFGKGLLFGLLFPQWKLISKVKSGIVELRHVKTILR